MGDFTVFLKELNSIIDNSKASPNTVVSNTAVESVASASASSSVVSATSVVPFSSNDASQKTVKMLIVSTHINQVNGYSKVVHNMIQQLSTVPWLKLVHFGTQKLVNASLGREYPSNVKVIDGTAMDKDKQAGFGLTELPGVIISEKPDVVFIYNDLAVIAAYIENIRKTIENRFFKIWTYVDMTYQSPPQAMIDIMNRDVERIFCFTKGWKENIKLQGITRPVDVLNHGVDSKIFRTIPRDMARQGLGLPKDVFLFTSLNKNIPRKRLDLLVMSFVKVMIRFPLKPIFMLIVADKGDRGGHQLFDIFAREIKLNGGSVDMFGNRLLITSTNTCYKDEDINLLYNCGDVGVSCAEAEGFGLCTFEQMAVGVPQIVPNINGYNEYCNSSNSLMIEPKYRCYLPVAYSSVPGEAQIVEPEDVSKAMEKYIFDEDLRKLHGKLAKENTSSYTWDKCVSLLIKRLKVIQEDDD
jgi:glycosyltransferase involved in cell wall biosynthesis